MATWKEREEVLLNSMGYQHTPITSDGSNYFALSLIDRGLLKALITEGMMKIGKM